MLPQESTKWPRFQPIHVRSALAVAIIPAPKSLECLSCVYSLLLVYVKKIICTSHKRGSPVGSAQSPWPLVPLERSRPRSPSRSSIESLESFPFLSPARWSIRCIDCTFPVTTRNICTAWNGWCHFLAQWRNSSHMLGKKYNFWQCLLSTNICIYTATRKLYI